MGEEQPRYEGPDRRADHDLIIKIAADLKHLCMKQDSYRGEMHARLKSIEEKADKQIEHCSCRMRDCNNFFVPNRVFYTALSIIVLVMGVLGTLAYEVKTMATEYISADTEARVQMEHRLDRLDDQYIYNRNNKNQAEEEENPN